jgi:hypothetical protein
MAGEVQGHEAVGGATARGKPDLNVKLPPAVKAAADRAEALSKQAREQREANEASGANELIGQSAQVPTAKPFGAQGGSSASSVVMANFDPRNPNPPSDVSSQLTNVAPPAPQQSTPQTPQDWEHQFNSLKGRYDQETANSRRMAQQLTDTQRLLAQLAATPSPVAQDGSGVRFSSPVAGSGQPQYQRRVTQQEVTEYGPELIDVMGRRAQEAVEPMLAQVLGELNAVKRQIGGVTNTQVFDARVRMYDDLKKEVPNWNVVNDSPEFGRWLDQIDPISGQLRRNLLSGAHNQNVTGQVVAIFKGFLSDVAALGLHGQGQQPGNGAGNPQSYNSGGSIASTPQVDLLSLAAPGRAKAGQTQVPPEKPVFKRTDITQFYHDRTHGRYAGREAEADQLERAIIEASNEGRIR